MSQTPFRIGAVSFANTIPLIEGLEGDPAVEITRDLPARLADLLYEGRIDVGLIPIVEYLRGVGGDIVPGICIASHGPVRTVKVFSKVPIEEASTIAVDRGSRSSVAMLRVLLAEVHGRFPDFHIVEPRRDHLFTHFDTVLVIGDRAEKVDTTDVPHVVDLGAWWTEFTGLPFVYAAWVLSPDLCTEGSQPRRRELIARLQTAKETGLAALPRLADQLVADRAVDREELLDYWRNTIGYELDQPELAGLTRFAELAAKHNLSPGRESVSLASA